MTTTTRRFIQCDVFSPIPTQGNALAVVVDAKGMSDLEMQRFAAWTNLAETTFLLPPDDISADYKVRIFTPSREMLFAGHPTLGSCAAWLHTGGIPHDPGTVRQECKIGIVEVDICQAPNMAFVAPPTTVQAMPDAMRENIITTLDISPEVVVRTALLDNGPTWQVLQLDTAEAVLAVDSSKVCWSEFRAIGLIGAHPATAECDYEVRMLEPSSGMFEDPITGSLNAAIAQWMHAEGRLTQAMTVAQGSKINRHGRVSIYPVLSEEERVLIYIGGHTHILIEGELRI